MVNLNSCRISLHQLQRETKLLQDKLSWLQEDPPLLQAEASRLQNEPFTAPE
jgi:hypothetical protein